VTNRLQAVQRASLCSANGQAFGSSTKCDLAQIRTIATVSFRTAYAMTTCFVYPIVRNHGRGWSRAFPRWGQLARVSHDEAIDSVKPAALPGEPASAMKS